jgi:CheY-like chemotaxis protein
VLVVDDNATSREVLTRHLTELGMKVGAANDGAGALAELRSAADAMRPYTITLIDLHMPGMDGLALARAINSDARIAKPRLLLLSSMGDLGMNEEIAKAKIAAQLTKPVGRIQLVDRLETVLADDAGRDAAPRQAPKRAELRSAFPGARVLLAEDERVNQMVASALLKKMGFVVQVVDNGLAAVDAAAAGQFDIILMDCNMPEMDGFMATKTIRASAGAASRVPIVAMTASAIGEARAECLAAGMNDFLTKPIVRPEELCFTIDRWLAQNQSAPRTA